MTVGQLAEKLKLKIYTGEEIAEEREVCGCFVGDLLSLAMSRLEENNVWVTIQTNVNIVAVASLAGCSLIVVAEGFCPDENAVSSAEAQGVILAGTELSAYDTSKALAGLGI